MKTKLPWILSVILAIALVIVVTGPGGNPPVQEPARKILFWVDPMHPAYKSDRPGQAPDCGMDLVPVYEGEVSPAADTSKVPGYANVALSSQRQQLLGIQTAIAERRNIGSSVRAVGRVALDERQLYRVTTKLDGYIERLYVNTTGAPVKRGQPLFTIYSPDLLATQQEYLLALRAAAVSPQLLEASRRRLRLWDISDPQIRELERTGVARKSLTVESPATGFVVTKTAIEGMRVSPGETLFEVAGLDRVWVLADVYESELEAVRIGASANISLSSIPGRIWAGQVSFIAPTIDPMTRTATVRVELDNPDAALKPEMFASVEIQQPSRETVVVPDSAVLKTGTRSIVFVVKEDGSFEPREVQTAAGGGDFIDIRSGVAAGERVVTQANFLIDSESRLKAALAQMSAPGAHSSH